MNASPRLTDLKEEVVSASVSKTLNVNLVRSVKLEWVFLLAVCATAVAIVLREPLWLGGDEGMELAKTVILLREPGMASTTWNDQPWLYSQILALGQLATGSWVSARLLSVFMFATMTIALWSILGEGASRGSRAAVLLVLLLWAPSWSLMCSAMMELPACAAVITGAAALFTAKSRRTWLVVGGMLVGFGISLKLTAAIFLPAIAALVLHGLWEESRSIERTFKNLARRAGRPAFYGLLGAGAVALVSVIISPAWSWDQLWRSHMNASAGMSPESHATYAFSISALLDYPAVVCMALLGIVGAVGGQGKSAAIFGVVGVLTATTIHLFHRPFWDYYMIHFSVPSALLVGIGTEWSLARLRQGWHAVNSNITAVQQLGLSIILLVPALALCFEIPGSTKLLKSCFAGERSQSNPIVQQLTIHAGKIKTGYAEQPIYLASAGLPSIPELTILPMKRFWSHAISEQKVWEIVNRKRPEAIVLKKSRPANVDLCRQVLIGQYVPVASDFNYVLYLTTELGVAELKSTSAELEQLGLGLEPRVEPLQKHPPQHDGTRPQSLKAAPKHWLR